MHIHVLQHVPFEGVGSIQAWAKTKKATLSTTHLFAAADLPSLADFDLLVVLGGPMSVNDEAELPWLIAEKQFVKAAVLAGKPVLGICLGAQLIANSLGARVYRNGQKEIGWFPVEACNTNSNTFCFPAKTEVFHWHGETFDLPPGAIHLASSEACSHQAFQIGKRTIGLQFHLETTPESADAIITHCRNELVQAPFIQTEELLRTVPDSRYTEINRLMESVLDYLVR